MGQYWIPVNLDRKEFINPHQLASGLKLWEQLANAPGVGAALVVLTAAMPEQRGGGDFDLETNWHGPERDDMAGEGPRVPAYEEIAKRTIGRWAGNRVALIGDYAEIGDIAACALRTGNFRKTRRTLPSEYKIYSACFGDKPTFRDVTADVCAVIEHELQGKFTGDGWREFERDTKVA